jgi:hypothetical protein
MEKSKGDSNKKRLELLCKNILNNKISRNMLKAYANTYINLINK